VIDVLLLCVSLNCAGWWRLIRLYDFPRSSSCYRVRIALNLKGLIYERQIVNLRASEQTSPDYLSINAQGLVPTLVVDGKPIQQSLAIIDYLDSIRPNPPFLPQSPTARALTLSLALVIACDVHPIDNLRVLTRLRSSFGADDDAVTRWYTYWVASGLSALELTTQGNIAGTFLNGEDPGLFEICLVPQLYNARRYAMDLTPYPTLCRIDGAARTLPEFAKACPDSFAPPHNT